jgi:hypothetical protein
MQDLPILNSYIIQVVFPHSLLIKYDLHSIKNMNTRSIYVQA